jgi:hypothetical protein
LSVAYRYGAQSFCLRLAFSLVLTPHCSLGHLARLPQQAGAGLPWGRLLAYLWYIMPLYGMNAFNSYYDRDEGPIGRWPSRRRSTGWCYGVALACSAGAHWPAYGGCAWAAGDRRDRLLGGLLAPRWR